MSIEAIKQALEALEKCMYPQLKQLNAITSLRQAIEQAEKQEPVAWVDVHDYTNLYYRKPAQVDVVPLYYGYPRPPKREWVGLMDEEIALVCAECAASAHNWNDISFARAIEAKLKDKNSK